MTPLVRILALLVAGVAMTSSHLVYDKSSSSALLNMSDLKRLLSVQEDIEKILDHSELVGTDLEETKEHIKRLYFVFLQVRDYLPQFRYECEKGELYKGKLCLFYSLDFTESAEQSLTQENAQQKCLSHQGHLFRPQLDDPNLLEGLIEAIPDLGIPGTDNPIVDGTEIATGDFAGSFEFSNGLLIPDDVIADPDEGETTDGLVLVLDPSSPYILEEGPDSANAYICQFDAVYVGPEAEDPIATGDDFIDLNPTPEELDHLTLTKIHKMLHQPDEETMILY